MNSKAEILKEEESGFEIDLSALVAQALQKQQAQEAEKYLSEIEQTPQEERLTWNTTPEQIARINAGERAALDEFYFNNYMRIVYSAHRFMRHNAYVKAVANYEDLIQQVYCDLRTGLLKLRPYDLAISLAIYHSFRYAAVGGMDEIYIHGVKQCQKQPN